MKVEWEKMTVLQLKKQDASTENYIPGYSAEESQLEIVSQEDVRVSFGNREGQLKIKTPNQGTVGTGEFMAYAKKGSKIKKGMYLANEGLQLGLSKDVRALSKWFVKNTDPGKRNKILYLEKLS